MAIAVRIPTILRNYTGGEKQVEASGSSLGSLHRFVNVYVNDEDVRFTGALDTGLSDGDEVTILPAVAGG